jgi:peptidoglycan/xylan/chitin deacetylase (PgdA/CDA1 family)
MVALRILSNTERGWKVAGARAAMALCMPALAVLPATVLPTTGLPTTGLPTTVLPTRLAGQPAARTVVTFTFDDGDADQMAAARALHKYGMNGTFYIITGAVGAPNYVTLSDLRTLAAEGDEIGGHTVSHLELPHVSAAEASRQACDGRNTLITWGFHVTSFAYPGGVNSPATEAIVRECGFNSARTVVGLRSPGCPRCTVAESVPPRDPYAIRVPGQADGTLTLAGMENVVTTAERGGGGWLPLIFHHICVASQCSKLAVRLSLLDAFAQWLAQRRDIGTVVETVGEVVGGPLRPMAGAPAAPPHDVINPGLETLGPPGGVNPTNEAPTKSAPFALCWMKAAYGRSSVTWQRIRDGDNGRWAMRLTMTSHRSGDAKLIQQLDLGQCSIPVTAGQSYNLAAWYESSTLTQFSVYYRTPQGRWLYWTSSPFYPAATQWARAAYTTPPVPAGGSGLSFGLTLSRDGSLTTDGHSILVTPRSVTRGIVDIALLVLLGLGAAAAGTRVWRRRLRGASAPEPGTPKPERRKGEGSASSSSNR